MPISLTRLSGGNTPADGSDPRTFPAIWNASATAIENAIATIPEGGASVTVSETAPVSPTEGDLWLNSTEAKMYVYYNDGTSAQWVAAVGGTVPSQGKILQVVSAARTSPFTTASTTLTDVTDLSVSITPASTANDVLVLVNVSAVLNGATNQLGQLTVTDGSDNIILGAASPGSRSVGFSQAYNSSAQIAVGDMSTHSFMLLHSPATTSAFTYKVRAKVSGDTMYVNRNVDDSDAVARMRGVSTITVMEVAG